MIPLFWGGLIFERLEGVARNSVTSDQFPMSSCGVGFGGINGDFFLKCTNMTPFGTAFLAS